MVQLNTMYTTYIYINLYNFTGTNYQNMSDKSRTSNNSNLCSKHFFILAFPKKYSTS